MSSTVEGCLATTAGIWVVLGIASSMACYAETLLMLSCELLGELLGVDPARSVLVLF